VYRLLDPPNIVLRGETFGEQNVFEIDVRLSLCPKFEERVQEHRLTLR
jgi:hypothetical protein